jgi:NhaP-type Na+/H+ or K+/H+ antiporter
MFIGMEPRIFLYVLVGVAVAMSLVLEKRLEKAPISLPILLVALGWAVFSLLLDLGSLNPAFDTQLATMVESATELIVIVSLVGVGLAIDRKYQWKEWKQVGPLLWLTMPLCIAGVAWMGWSWLGLAPAAALLLGACLAPTDPVLARAVQVGPPGESCRDDVRFNLSAEAGFNDSLAFPFVYLAIALSLSSPDVDMFAKWFGVDVVWRITAGYGVGWLTGKAASWIVFRNSSEDDEEDGPGFFKGREGLLVVASLFIAYGVAEMIEGYGFIAVFIGAVTARQCERRHDLHKRTHGFIDQIENLMLVAILIFFGGLLASGVLGALTWWSAALGAVILLILRPLAGVLAMSRSGLPWQARWAVGFLGIRGIGSVYYLSYGQVNGKFGNLEILWSTVAFVILLSIIIHGVTASSLLGYLKKRGLMTAADTNGTVV